MWDLRYKTKINIQNQKDKYLFNYAVCSRACFMTFFSGNILIVVPSRKSDLPLIQKLLNSVNLEIVKEIKMVIDLN